MAKPDRHGGHHHNGANDMKIDDLLVNRYTRTLIMGWVSDFDAIDDNSQKEWASNNSDSDEDEQSIHINDEAEEGEIKENNKDEENIDMQVDEVKDIERDQTNESKSVIKPTWAEEINNLEAKENVLKAFGLQLLPPTMERKGVELVQQIHTLMLEVPEVVTVDPHVRFFVSSKADLKKYIDSIGVHGSLQETHVQRIDLFKLKRLRGNYQFDFASSSTVGKWVFKKMKCFMVNVYAPQEERKKKDLWNFIRNFMSNQPGHYFVFGDFNVVRFSSERIGLFNHRPAFDFNDFIKYCKFWDVPLGGHAFTRISGNGEKLSRIDRFLLSEDVTNIVPNLMAVSLDRAVSPPDELDTANLLKLVNFCTQLGNGVGSFDAIDDNSQKEWASNNSDSDEDEQSIHINDEAEEGEIKENNKDEENIDMQVDEVKDTKRDQTNESESEEINKDRDQEVSNSPSKPPGFEGFRSSTSTFNHGKKRSRANSANSHFNARGSRSGNRRSTGSLIDAFISHIEMGSVLGYDMEGSKADLKKYIDSIGVHGSLQETHVQRIDLFKIKRLWGNYQFDFASSSAVGRSVGLLSIWDPSIFIKANIFSMENLLIVEGEWVFKKIKCFMVNVYAPQEERKNKDLWNFIRNFMFDQPGHYFVFGDFNVVRFSSKRIGSLFNHRSASDFNEFIKDCKFWDVPLGGHAFTRISGNGEKLSRLDRFLLSKMRLNNCSFSVTCTLYYEVAPQSGIPLRCDFTGLLQNPFKFYNSWLFIPDFDGMVTKVWDQSHGISGPNAMLVFKDKMKHLKSNIKLWARKFNASKSEEKVQLSSKIADVERDLEAGLGSSSLHFRRKDLLLKLRNIERAESLDAYQKAKIK
ncbi:RNA-directed DNA polymerase, eukaryota, reverse transcriptase zinc-binding domain protein [Tanacetum coccineum]